MLDSLTKVGKVGLGIFVVGVVVFVVGFSVPYWVAFETSKWRFGLWEACVSGWQSSTYCVSTLSEDFRAFPDLPGWFKGTQACACFALLSIIADIVLRGLFIAKKLKHFLLISVVLDIAAGALALLGAVIFGSEINKYDHISLSWGFAFDIIGGILLGGSAVCFFIEYCRRR